MAVGKQNPREPRGLYHMFRPNTVLWGARIATLLPLLAVAAMIMLAKNGVAVNFSNNPNVLTGLLYAALMLGGFISVRLNGGLMQYTPRKQMDEFQWALVERARLFAYRVLTILLFGFAFIVPALEGFFDGFRGAERSRDFETYVDGYAILVLCALTVAPAYYHWKLKPVEPEDKIRPDPPFMTDEDVEKGFWRR